MRRTSSALPNTTFRGRGLPVVDGRPSRKADFTLMEFVNTASVPSNILCRQPRKSSKSWSRRDCAELSIDSGKLNTIMYWALDGILVQFTVMPFIEEEEEEEEEEDVAVTNVSAVRAPLDSPVI
ncbi:unnamed protein product [Echinostoma caproni]|uniref:Uncharacterized protein n=1 Tax=Echinostoma caproni TaxID=27848 RepID=A0A182ZZW3_9TREM|nr:unnamed protein product [Echinostoma caproni]